MRSAGSGFSSLVIAIGFAALYFGGSGHEQAKPAAAVTHAAR